MTLDAEEFIRRFLLHVLPNAFQRVRHFGFLANRSKKKSLARCIQLLGATNADSEPTPLTSEGIALRCPICARGVMITCGPLQSTILDSS